MLVAANAVTSIKDPVLGQMALAFLLLIAAAHILGNVAARLRQPRMIGEIVAGILLGPSLLGRFAPGISARIFGAGGGRPPRRRSGLPLQPRPAPADVRVGVAPSATCSARRTARPTISSCRRHGAPFPSPPWCLRPVLRSSRLMGPAGQPLGPPDRGHRAAAAVTSIPVISKIFSDLGILHTRFASLMLGSAVMEDIALWGVIAISTTIAAATASGGPAGHVDRRPHRPEPRLLRPGHDRHARRAPPAGPRPLEQPRPDIAGHVDDGRPVRLRRLRRRLRGQPRLRRLPGRLRHRRRHEGHRAAALPGAIDADHDVSLAVFIPLYFAIIGYKLDFTKTFSPVLLIGFLVGSSIVRMVCLSAAARLAGFRGRPLVNLAVTSNARGGPGIVLASVAFDAHIINASFFTTLVLTAVLTSQVCGWWLDHVLRRGGRCSVTPRRSSGPGPTSPSTAPPR